MIQKGTTSLGAAFGIGGAESRRCRPIERCLDYKSPGENQTACAEQKRRALWSEFPSALALCRHAHPGALARIHPKKAQKK